MRFLCRWQHIAHQRSVARSRRIVSGAAATPGLRGIRGRLGNFRAAAARGRIRSGVAGQAVSFGRSSMGTPLAPSRSRGRGTPPCAPHTRGAPVSLFLREGARRLAASGESEPVAFAYGAPVGDGARNRAARCSSMSCYARPDAWRAKSKTDFGNWSQAGSLRRMALTIFSLPDRSPKRRGGRTRASRASTSCRGTLGFAETNLRGARCGVLRQAASGPVGRGVSRHPCARDSRAAVARTAPNLSADGGSRGHPRRPFPSVASWVNQFRTAGGGGSLASPAPQRVLRGRRGQGDRYRLRRSSGSYGSLVAPALARDRLSRA